MCQLKTTFAGLELNNPFIVSSCGLTASPDKNKKWEDAGAGAIVLKSLFQEEIETESESMNHGAHAEELDYLLSYHRGHRLAEYIQLIKNTKQLCTIPIIASINCYHSSEWTEFAKSLAEAGADAIELNIMSICGDLEYQYGDFEKMHIDILREVKSVVNIPVIVKLGSKFTNCIPLIHQLYANGAAGVVLFNRMVTPDIDIDNKKYVPGYSLQTLDFSEVLRWTGLATAYVPKMNIAASGGVGDGKTMIKALLAGASAVEVCSALYRHGPEVIAEMLQTLKEWMEKNEYASIDDFKGMMNADNEEANVFERTQFFRLFTHGKMNE